jgi:hypothetical protein
MIRVLAIGDYRTDERANGRSLRTEYRATPPLAAFRSFITGRRALLNGPCSPVSASHYTGRTCAFGTIACDACCVASVPPSAFGFECSTPGSSLAKLIIVAERELPKADVAAPGHSIKDSLQALKAKHNDASYYA